MNSRVNGILTGVRVLRILLALAAISIDGHTAEQAPAKDTPWWKQKKIVFMWRQWNYARIDHTVGYWIGELPREHFRRVARAGWYHRDIEVPALTADQRVYLHFGAVDEHLVLWIDGMYAGDYDREPNGDGINPSQST